LAPLIHKEIWTRLRALKAMGLSLILIDKDLQALADIADRHYILEKGTIVWTGTSSELLSDAEMGGRGLNASPPPPAPPASGVFSASTTGL
jgi:branched-chain amino acid transport system ATP-binding protein